MREFRNIDKKTRIEKQMRSAEMQLLFAPCALELSFTVPMHDEMHWICEFGLRSLLQKLQNCEA
jgi:hypothetical protein